jgi:hypothetical protein
MMPQKGADISNASHEGRRMVNLAFVNIKAKSERQKRIMLIVRSGSNNARG